MKYLKTKILQKLVIFLLLISTPTQSLAAKGIFFNSTTATNLASDIDYYEKISDSDTKIINNLTQTNDKLLSLSKEYQDKIIGLDQDKAIYKTRGDKLEVEFKTCVKDLQDALDGQPSRLVWFGVGATSSLVAVIAILFLVK